ncbi:hypothetical protein PCANC_12327 [Puccinia coronata f. sp. avenae]|nr:hypothetical protein PCANC_12327 [Puccinia coronata f. sp. avenae]
MPACPPKFSHDICQKFRAPIAWNHHGKGAVARPSPGVLEPLALLEGKTAFDTTTILAEPPTHKIKLK